MPSNDVDVEVSAWHWDWAVSRAIRDDVKGPYTLKVKEPIIKVGPIPKIEQFWPIAEAQAGSTVTYKANIRNVGDQPGWFRLHETRVGLNYIAGSWTWFAEIPVGGILTFTGTFLMPDFNITVTLQAEWWDEPAQTWRDGGDPVGYSIAVVRDPWPEVGMPRDLWDFLSGKWCNVYEGQWVSVTLLGYTFNVPLWSFTPGIYARDAIQWTIDVVNTLIGDLRDIWVKAQEAWKWAREAKDAIADWTTGAFSWFRTQVSDWWGTTWPPIQKVFTTTLNNLNVDLAGAWSTIRGLNNTLSALQIDYQSFKINIFKDILNLDVFQVLKDGFNSFQEFATNPLDWIYGKVADFVGWLFEKVDDWLNETVE